jgi:hypothetical protein
MTILQEWKQAVVHLECATDSEHFYDRIQRIDEQRAQLEKGEITPEQFAREIAGRSRDVRYHGTALFIRDVGRRYLLTARHVVWDELSAVREIAEEEERAASWPEHMRGSLIESARERAQGRIFNIIFRVPRLDEVLAGRSARAFLMNLGAGTSYSVPYTFSDPGLDLACISLDQRDTRFGDELETLGLVPIDSDNIADGPDSEAQEVFTVGFPSSTALLGQLSQHEGESHWSSSYFSLPVASFGRVSMLHDALPFYWADLSIYPGNSGGPVVGGDRLVGIVSAQATMPIVDAVPDVRTRIPFAKIIKTSIVRSLLATQRQKDQH